MKKSSIKLNKWHFIMGIIPSPIMRQGIFIHFGIFKLLSFPPEGQLISKSEYKGFWFRKNFSPSGFELFI